MSDSIKAVIPKELQDFNVAIENYKGDAFNITASAVKVTIFETIHQPYLNGSIVISDGNGMFDILPIIGQERIRIYFKYKDKEIDRVFRVTHIEDAKQLNENSGAYTLHFVDEKIYYNAVQFFSRSYKGKSTDIISAIHKDFLKEPVEVLSDAGSSHNMVYPYVKPYQAINMLLLNAPAADGTPMFMYDTLNEPGVKIQSLADMWAFSDYIELRNLNQLNTEVDGQVTRMFPSQNRTVDEMIIKESFNTLDNLAEGQFAAAVTTVDISGKYYAEEIFDYKKHTTDLHPDVKDYVADQFKFNDRTPHESFYSKHILYVKDSKAYESEAVGNLYNIDSIRKASFRAYYKSMKNSKILIKSDSHEKLTVGKTVHLFFKRMFPNIDRNDDIDKVNSGLYLCTAIRHTIQNNKYELTIEAARHGINKEANL